MSSELKYHENMRNRLAAEGWPTVVLHRALRFGLGWATFLIVLYWVASRHREIPPIMFPLSPIIAGIIGFLQSLGFASLGRDLKVTPRGSVVLDQDGRSLVARLLSEIASVETVSRSPKQITIRISFPESDPDSFMFSATATPAQQEELLNTLQDGMKE